MIKRNAESSKTRNTWADVTSVRISEIDAKIRLLEAERERVRDDCNHTFPDGRSALEFHDDDEGGGLHAVPAAGTDRP